MPNSLEKTRFFDDTMELPILSPEVDVALSRVDLSKLIENMRRLSLQSDVINQDEVLLAGMVEVVTQHLSYDFSYFFPESLPPSLRGFVLSIFQKEVKIRLLDWAKKKRLVKDGVFFVSRTGSLHISESEAYFTLELKLIHVVVEVIEDFKKMSLM